MSLNKGLIFHAPLNSKSEKVGEELLTNPNFTSYSGESFTGWVGRDSDNVVTYSHQNNFNQNIADCIRMYYDSNATTWWYQRIYQYVDTDLEVGKTYYVKVWARSNKIISAHMRISSLNSANVQLSLNSTLSTEWIKYEGTFTCTDTTDLTFWLGASGVELPVAGDWFEFAQASIKELKTADITPNANHGIVYGATQNDDYMEFNGSNNTIVFNGNKLPSGNDIFTISAWIDPDVQSNRIITFWGNATTNQANGFRLYDTDKIKHYFWANDYVVTIGTLSSGYHNFCIVHLGNGIREFYLDGIEVTTGASYEGGPSTPNVVANTLYVGSRLGSAEWFDGGIKDIRIYNRALSESEIKQLYKLQGRQNNIQTGNLYKNLILDMPLTSKYNTNDLTPNNNNGVNNGAVIRNHGIRLEQSLQQYVEIPYMQNLTGNFSIFAWVKYENTSSYYHIFTSDNQVYGAFKIDLTATAYFYHTDTSSLMFTNSLIRGNWYHLGITYDGTTLKQYINNNLDNSHINSSVKFNSITNIYRIGKWNGEYSLGNEADIKIFDYALSTDQISQLYNNSNSIIGNVLDMPLNNKYQYNDRSGNYYHGINNGTNLIGDGGYFDGSSAYINCGHKEKLNITKNITISTWLNISELNDGTTYSVDTIVDKQIYNETSFGRGFQLCFYHNNKILFTYNYDEDRIYKYSNKIFDSSDINIWHHICYVYNGDEQFYYINGELDNNGAESFTVNFEAGSTSSQNLYIGRRSLDANRKMYGNLKDIRIYNRALSESEIKQLYLKGLNQ